MARLCWASPIGGCSDRFDKEHIISGAAAVGRNLTLPRKFTDEYVRYSIDSVQSSKILCKSHNNLLGEILESKISSGVRSLVHIQHQQLSDALKDDVVEYEKGKIGLIIDGRQLERWLLRTLFNFSLSNVAATNREQLVTQIPGQSFVEYVFGIEGDLPAEVGLFWMQYENRDLRLQPGSQSFRIVPGVIRREGTEIGRRISALRYDCGLGAIPLVCNADCYLSDGDTLIEALNSADLDLPRVLAVTRRPSALRWTYADVLRCVVFDWGDGIHPEEFDLIRRVSKQSGTDH